MAATKTKRNPSYETMAIQAVASVTSQNNQRSCSSQAIKTFLIQKFSIELTSSTRVYLKRGLERALDNNKLVRLTGIGLSGSFRLPMKKRHSLVNNVPRVRRKRVQKAPEPEVLNSKNSLPPPPPPPPPVNKTKTTTKSATVARVILPARRKMFRHNNVQTKTPSTTFDELSAAEEVSFSILMTSDAASQDTDLEDESSTDGEISTNSDTLTSGQEDTSNSETNHNQTTICVESQSDSDQELWDDLEEESD